MSYPHFDNNTQNPFQRLLDAQTQFSGYASSLNQLQAREDVHQLNQHVDDKESDFEEDLNTEFQNLQKKISFFQCGQLTKIRQSLQNSNQYPL